MAKFKDEFGEDYETENLCVCRYCFAAIEAHEGRQAHKIHDLPDDEPFTCEWCEEETTEVYEIV